MDFVESHTSMGVPSSDKGDSADARETRLEQLAPHNDTRT